jgi:hypothetical protein
MATAQGRQKFHRSILSPCCDAQTLHAGQGIAPVSKQHCYNLASLPRAGIPAVAQVLS